MASQPRSTRQVSDRLVLALHLHFACFVPSAKTSKIQTCEHGSLAPFHIGWSYYNEARGICQGFPSDIDYVMIRNEVAVSKHGQKQGVNLKNVVPENFHLKKHTCTPSN